MKPVPEALAEFERLTASLGDVVERRQMMGSPTLMRDAAMIAALVGDGLAVKLGRDRREHAEALAIPGARLWHPGGGPKAFRDWVELPFAARELWLDQLRAAIDIADEVAVTDRPSRGR